MNKLPECKCSKCHDTRIVNDGGLFIVAMITGRETVGSGRVYPCPKCCPELHKAVAKEYQKLLKAGG